MAYKPADHTRHHRFAREFEAVSARIREINARYNEGEATTADMQEIGELSEKVIRLKNEMQNPPFAKLFNAAGDGRLAQVRRYIERDGMHVDTRNYGGATPIIYAARDGNPKLVRYLIDKGADVNARDDHGITPLAQVVCRNNAELLRMLLEAGANPRVRTNDGLTLRKLAEFNNSEAVLTVLNDKAYMAQFAKKAAGPKPKA